MVSDILDNREVNVLEDLKDIFENINQWLIFAETKNGVLLGINGLFIFKMLDSLNGVEESILNTNMMWSLLITFVITTIIILKSFFPVCSVFEDKPVNLCKEIDGNSKVLIFYEDISKYENSKIYLRDLCRHYYDIDVNFDDLKKYELDYSKEILINSRITSYKYRCFRWALKLNGLGIFLLILFHFIS